MWSDLFGSWRYTSRSTGFLQPASVGISYAVIQSKCWCTFYSLEHRVGTNCVCALARFKSSCKILFFLKMRMNSSPLSRFPSYPSFLLVIRRTGLCLLAPARRGRKRTRLDPFAFALAFDCTFDFVFADGFDFAFDFFDFFDFFVDSFLLRAADLSCACCPLAPVVDLLASATADWSVDPPSTWVVAF